MLKTFRNNNALCVSTMRFDGEAWDIRHSNDGGYTFFSGERFRDKDLLDKRMAEISPIENWQAV